MSIEPKSCDAGGFNYCKWAKTLVAIPALPLIAIFAALFFENNLLQVIQGLGAVTVAVMTAIWIDNIPLLQKKFRTPKREQL